jgi:hypothetical protein
MLHTHVILGLYVDDSILVFNNITFLNTTKMEQLQTFDMTNNGELHYFLGIQVNQNRSDMPTHINQEKYIGKALTIWDGKL